MSESPKLFTNKPKKAQKKQPLKGSEMQSPSSAAAESYKGGGGGGGGGVKPPELPRRKSFARRYKFLWPLLLGVNVAVGAYLFVRTKKKDPVVEEEAPSPPSPTAATPTPPPTVAQTPPPLPLPVAAAPVKPPEPVPENLQRELFKWVLEEKRKIKPRDSEEKKRLEEDKAVLKQFIRAKSIPPL